MAAIVIVLLLICFGQLYTIQSMKTDAVKKGLHYSELLRRAINEQQAFCAATNINHLSDSNVDSELRKQGWVEDTE